MNAKKAGFGAKAALVAIGIVYGDIGTSPMYVMKSIVEGNGSISSMGPDMVLGSLSLIIWTLILLTTVKYVLIAMQADNHGEGGIFALFSVVRKYGTFLIIPAVIGGSALLADGVLTPAVTVTTAIEGLRTIPRIHSFLGETQTRIIAITLIIIALLFLVQRAGTSFIGKAFGPVMTLWFFFLAVSGLYRIADYLVILKALNPLRAIQVLCSPFNHMGFMILGSVFLATTGAEALYSDMGHVGKQNIYISWPFVKLCLILNYLGQGAWILTNQKNPSILAIQNLNPFFEMLPEAFRFFAVLLSTLAAVIASQALITGAFTLVSEACRLDLFPHMQIVYPSETKGQLYIPVVNHLLWILCSALVLFFKDSQHMEAAYGLAITLTMLMTTILLSVFISFEKGNKLFALIFFLFFGTLEGSFLISSLSKFMKGGYVALMLACILMFLMFIWYRGTEIENSQSIHLKTREYISQLHILQQDSSIPFLSDNLVFMTKNQDTQTLERDILYSILDKTPKRAKAYWFISIHVTEEPYQREYTVENFGTDFVFRINLYLGFKTEQRVNVFLRQIVNDLIKSGELPPQEHIYGIHGNSDVGSFRFCMIRKRVIPESDLSASDRTLLQLKYVIRYAAGSSARWYGLETSDLTVEYVPLFIKMKALPPINRQILGSFGSFSH